MNNRRKLLAFVWAALTMTTAIAGEYPTKPIRIIVSLAPGGGVDTTGRLIGQKFTEAWGQQVVVENRPGALRATTSVAIVPPAPGRFSTTTCWPQASVNF